MKQSPSVPVAEPRQRKKKPPSRHAATVLPMSQAMTMQGVFGTVGAVEVGETGVAAAVLADVVPDDEVG